MNEAEAIGVMKTLGVNDVIEMFSDWKKWGQVKMPQLRVIPVEERVDGVRRLRLPYSFRHKEYPVVNLIKVACVQILLNGEWVTISRVTPRHPTDPSEVEALRWAESRMYELRRRYLDIDY